MTKDRIGKILFGIAGMLIVACELVVICVLTMVNIGGITYVHNAIGYFAAIILLITGSLFIKKPVSAVVFAVMLILNIWFFAVMVTDANNGGLGAYYFLMFSHTAVGIIYSVVTLKYMFPRASGNGIFFIIAVVLVMCLIFLGGSAFLLFFIFTPIIAIPVAIFSLAWFVSAFKKPAVSSPQ